MQAVYLSLGFLWNIMTHLVCMQSNDIEYVTTKLNNSLAKHIVTLSSSSLSLNFY